MEEKHKRMIIAELLVGLSEIHKKKICHRDLKPENVLLDKRNHMKICDFGESKRFDEQSMEQLAQFLLNNDIDKASAK